MQALALQSANGWSRFVSMQNHLNLLYREEEREILPLCRDQGIGVIPWSPLARGRLARGPDEKTERSETDKFGTYLYRKTVEADRAVIERVGEIAAAPGVSRGQAALALALRETRGHSANRRRNEDRAIGRRHRRRRIDAEPRRGEAVGRALRPSPRRWICLKAQPHVPQHQDEISGGILMGNPLLPIKPCSFPAPCPGIDAVLLDESGNPVERGKVGELSIRRPWIGMARGFWEEPQRYLHTYWTRFDKIWVHGDWAMQDADGHWYILGRSDDTLKVAGKRVGPAEVESLLVAHEQVTEAAVIGVPDEVKGTVMVAFCVLGSGIEGTRELGADLKQLVAKDMGNPLSASRIHFVSALPKTRNAKVMRRVIRAAYLGEDAGDLSALENPQTLNYWRARVAGSQGFLTR